MCVRQHPRIPNSTCTNQVTQHRSIKLQRIYRTETIDIHNISQINICECLLQIVSGLKYDFWFQRIGFKSGRHIRNVFLISNACSMYDQ